MEGQRCAVFDAPRDQLVPQNLRHTCDKQIETTLDRRVDFYLQQIYANLRLEPFRLSLLYMLDPIRKSPVVPCSYISWKAT